MQQRVYMMLLGIPYYFVVLFTIFGLMARQYGFNYLALLILTSFSLVYGIIYAKKLHMRKSISIILLLLTIMGNICFGFLARGTIPNRMDAAVWKMHDISNPGYLIPNGLDSADLNQDGALDYLTNYEWDGKIRIAFSPGTNPDQSWESITVGNVPNAENCVFGHMDGDITPDIVVVHGAEMGAKPGVFIIWAPNSSQIQAPNAWIQSADIPGSGDLGHFNYVRTFDINGDGFDEIFIGGRTEKIGTVPGIRWFEGPTTGDRRDLSLWKIHTINEVIDGGYGFEFADIDLDGDMDLAQVNSDLDTHPEDRKVMIYENPGLNSSRFRQSWSSHILYYGPEFFSKPQCAIQDFNGDLYPEIVTQTDLAVYIFINPKTLGGTWTLIKIDKPSFAQGRSRPLEIHDINNDTKPEIIMAGVHKDGYFPASRAAIYYMNYTGNDPLTAQWTTNVIKWSDGFFGLGEWNGEKWDQICFEDVDRDGDIDVVANVEEMHSLGFCVLAVVWFENPQIA